MKRKLRMMLALAVLLTALCCGTALANASGTCGDSLTWTFNSSTGKLTISGTGPMEDYSRLQDRPWASFSSNIKSVSVGSGVTSIGIYAFYGCDHLTSVTIPNTVSVLESYCLQKCSSLTGITIPDSVTTIGVNAFEESGLTRVTIGSGVKKLDNRVFRNCTGLSNVVIPVKVERIDWEAFRGCTGLTSITITNPCCYINENAFADCSSSLAIRGWDTSTAQEFCGLHGFHFVSLGVFSGSCGESVAWTFSRDTGLLSITGTGAMADYDDSDNPWGPVCKGIQSVNIGSGVTSIGNYAFSDCSKLTNITIPGSVTSIGNYAFYECSKLTSITIPDRVTSLGIKSFSYCTSLTSITIPKSVTSIDDFAFCKCNNMTSITFLNPNVTMGLYLFDMCRIDIIIRGFNPSTAKTYAEADDLSFESLGDLSGSCGNNVTYTYNYRTCMLSITGSGAIKNFSAGSTPWYGMRDIINSVAIEQGVTSIGSNAFYGLACMTRVTIPNGIKNISAAAFDGCASLTAVFIPNSVTNINYLAFNGCASLTSASIPVSVTNIGYLAFNGCASLASVDIYNDSTDIGDDNYDVFQGCSSGLVLRGYSGSTAQAYAEASGIPFIHLTKCGENVYYRFDQESGALTIWGTGDMNNYSTSVLPHWADDSITSFRTCISSVVIESGVTSIGSYAFYYCTNLTGITIPDSVTSIGEHAFYGCTVLTGITIPDSVTSIGKHAFYECTGLTSITIPNSVSSIASSTFYGCSNLTSITIPNGVTNIGNDAFSYCTSLASVTIPDGVTSIDDNAFQYCTSLTSATIPDSVTSIGASVFSGCTGLTSITIPNGVVSIGYNAFYGCTGLTSVTISSGVTYIDNGAFFGCTGLTSVTIPNSVTGIGRENIIHRGGVFQNCSNLISITIPNSVTSIGPHAFDGCTSLTSATILNPGCIIGNNSYNVFKNCAPCFILCGYNSSSAEAYASAANISFESLGDIPESSGSCGSNLTWTFTFATNVLTISGTGPMDDYDYYNKPGWYSYLSRITAVTIYDGVTSIGECAFAECTGLTSITIPNGVTSIGECAFAECTGLTSITIPNSVTGIGECAFAECTGLERVIIMNPACTFKDASSDTFIDCSASLIFYGWADSTAQAYAEAAGRIFVPIDDSYFCGDHAIWLFDLASGVLTITGTGPMWNYSTSNPSPFSNRSDILTAVIGEGVTHVGAFAFIRCSALASVSFPDSLRTFGTACFNYCRQLNHVMIPYGVTAITGFDGCTALTDISLPDSLTTIMPACFYYCNGFVTLDFLPDSVTSIGYNAFRGCANLTTVYVPRGVRTISSYVFRECPNLSSISIPHSVTYIDTYAFDGDTNLASVYYEGIRADWDMITIREGNDPLKNATIHCKAAVIFDSCGGTEVPMQALNYMECAARPEAPVRDGYLFIDWYDNAEYTGAPFDFATPVIGDTTLYARWVMYLKLPAALAAIESEAFAGIAAQAVVIPGNVTSITGNPFAGSSVRYIYGYANSAAQTLANTYPDQFTFVPIDDSWLASH